MKKFKVYAVLYIVCVLLLNLGFVKTIERNIYVEPETLPVVHTQSETKVEHTAPATLNRGEERFEPREYLAQLCAEYGVPYSLAGGIVTNESNWNAKAFNLNDDGSVDIGYFQLNSYCWADIGEKIGSVGWDPYNPKDNMKAGVMYLKYWLNYWSEKGLAGDYLINMTISSYAAPSHTATGRIQWWYITLIRNIIGW